MQWLLRGTTHDYFGPSHGYKDEKGELQESQPLQRMLYLEKWDIFAPASFKGAQPICYYCRQAGHIRSTCPELAKRRCFGCGETGHTKRFCKIKVPIPQPAETSESETELLFVVIKRRGNFANGNQESDMIKLGKQMQVALNKMVLKNVQSPEVVGLLVQEGEMAIAYKMDLEYNGQYRMVELSRFYFLRDNVDDVLLLPVCHVQG